MGLFSDLRVIYHIVFAKSGGDNHGARLEAFYRHQADAYDDFRKRLLHGREQMMRGLELPDGARLVDMGAGTGSNLECLADRIPRLGQVFLVDLSPSLLRVAKERVDKHGWSNVQTVHADATTFEPEGGPVDAVTFSYSLTMIPDWFQVIDQAYRILKPGGSIGVADFFVARKFPGDGHARHTGFRRFFWPTWFGYDNVFLSPDHIPYLQSRFQTLRLEEKQGRMPYLLDFKAPYYVFVGRKA